MGFHALFNFMIPSVHLHPWRQALYIFLATLMGIFIIRSGSASGEWEWMVACTGILFFSLVNPLISVFEGHKKHYTLFSFLGFAAVFVGCLLAAKLISPEPLNAYPHYRFILLTTGIFFFLATGVGALIRMFLSLTEPKA